MTLPDLKGLSPLTRVDIIGEGHVSLFGAKLDARMQQGVSITTGTPTVTGLTGMVLADEGKIFIFYGAGAAGGNLVTTILAYISATSVTLANNASTTVSGGKIIYGTNDTAAFQSAIDADSDLTVSGLYGGQVYFDGSAIINASLVIKNKSIDFGGNGWGALSTDTSTPSTTPGAGLIWAGVADLPMIDVDRCLGSYIHDFRLFGNSSAKPIGIRIQQGAGGTHLGSYNNFARIWLGVMTVGTEPDGAGRQFSTAIYGYTTVGNTDFQRFETIIINRADIGFESNHDQITYWPAHNPKFPVKIMLAPL